jgi:hypothetical protein
VPKCANGVANGCTGRDGSSYVNRADASSLLDPFCWSLNYAEPTFLRDDTSSPTLSLTMGPTAAFVGDFAPCNICGDNLVIGTLEETTFNPVDMTRPTCEEFDAAGKAGAIDPGLCLLLPAVVATNCDCMSFTSTTGTPTPAPVITTGVPTTVIRVAVAATGTASPSTSTSSPTTKSSAGRVVARGV